ncbi:NAD(P)-dependent oxidoreductase [Atopomonas sediminilitoris]|uniref:NAD(P)-dependent oxidoreductase n=1 Tax=Atopomonas sediminilitoris TaxID=2919919 RepID=UPI001F4D7716|nr:NAD(P)-dependent oxidoreductase [Atopomonas sediminilitoris]
MRQTPAAQAGVCRLTWAPCCTAREQAMTLRVGFAGIGLMGLPLCQRLLAAGVPLTVFNRTPSKCEPLRQAGARHAQSLAELAEHSDVLMLCLADTHAVRELMFAEHGLAQHLRAGQRLVDFSSLEPTATCEMAARLWAERGVPWIDAPVSGGVQGAAAGSLVVMAGGAAADIDALRPLLAHLSQRVTRMGEVGAGQVTKVCNQMLVACNALVIAEVVALAERCGVDAAQLAPALAGGFADSKPLQILAPQMAAREFEPIKWHVRTLRKDLDTAVKLSLEQGSSAPMADTAATLMRRHSDNGYAEQDPATLLYLHRSPEHD